MYMFISERSWNLLFKIKQLKKNPQLCTAQEGVEEINNIPEVYTTQEGIWDIKNIPRAYTT